MSGTKDKILVVDLGISNILSLKNAIEFCGAKVIVSNKKEEIKNCDKLILPGVGSFSKGMKNLNRLKIKDALIRHCYDNKFLLGICLGMQLLFKDSFENGHFQGLNILKGSIKKLPSKKKSIKIPHINWAEVEFKKNNKVPFLKNIKSKSYYYFVHSYYASNIENKNLLGQTKFGSFIFPSVVRKNNIYGIQFHAEKSSANGIQMLKNFLKI